MSIANYSILTSGSEQGGGAVGVRRIKQRRRIIILRDDHLGDPIGRMFIDASDDNGESILECLSDYLGRRVKVLRAEVSSQRAEVDVELQALVEEANRLSAAAKHLQRKGARRNAISLFKESLQLDPLNHEAAKGLGLLLVELAEYGEALKALKYARESGHDDVELLFGLARACLELERRASAIAYLEQAFELDPANFGVRRTLVELGRRPKPPSRVRTERRQPTTSKSNHHQ
jgi:tetratricopeptide (TPR) repeat protein